MLCLYFEQKNIKTIENGCNHPQKKTKKNKNKQTKQRIHFQKVYISKTLNRKWNVTFALLHSVF